MRVVEHGLAVVQSQGFVEQGTRESSHESDRERQRDRQRLKEVPRESERECVCERLGIFEAVKIQDQTRSMQVLHGVDRQKDHHRGPFDPDANSRSVF